MKNSINGQKMVNRTEDLIQHRNVISTFENTNPKITDGTNFIQSSVESESQQQTLKRKAKAKSQIYDPSINNKHK